MSELLLTCDEKIPCYREEDSSSTSSTFYRNETFSQQMQRISGAKSGAKRHFDDSNKFPSKRKNRKRITKIEQDKTAVPERRNDMEEEKKDEHKNVPPTDLFECIISAAEIIARRDEVQSNSKKAVTESPASRDYHKSGLKPYSPSSALLICNEEILSQRDISISSSSQVSMLSSGLSSKDEKVSPLQKEASNMSKNVQIASFSKREKITNSVRADKIANLTRANLIANGNGADQIVNPTSADKISNLSNDEKLATLCDPNLNGSSKTQMLVNMVLQSEGTKIPFTSSRSIKLEATSNRVPLSSWKAITEGFFWKDYPPLEAILRNHMTQYYGISTTIPKSRAQRDFNNRLVIILRRKAEEHGWYFDLCDKKIRDRVRCFFKTHVQNARRRLNTVLQKKAALEKSDKLERSKC